MKNQKNKTEEPNGIMKTQIAEGNKIFTAYGYGRLDENGLFHISDPLKAMELSEDINFRDGVDNLMRQIFPAPPEIWVTNPDGETDGKLTKQRREDFDRLRGYAAMKTAMLDIFTAGASVKSVGTSTQGNVVTLDEIRNLQWISFSRYPGSGKIINEFLPGIVVNDEGETEVWQWDSKMNTKQIRNFIIIKQDETPEPSGTPYCLPVYVLVAIIIFGMKAATQQVNRVGAPVIMPKAIDDIDDDTYKTLLDNWFPKFGKMWGKDISFLIPPGVEFPDLKIREGSTARDFVQMCIGMVRTFFNPTTDLQNTGASIGASDSGRMEIWANHISSLQSLAETWLENIFTKINSWNGYEGYITHIRLKRPSVDKSAIRLQYLQALVSAKSITTEEIRDNSTDILELKDYSPELEQQLKSQYPETSTANMFFGNVAPATTMTTTEEKLITQTENKLLKINSATNEAINKIMGYPKE